MPSWAAEAIAWKCQPQRLAMITAAGLADESSAP